MDSWYNWSNERCERMNQYDNPEFFAEYAKMSRSQYGLEGAGEWHQLEPMFPELNGKTVLDLGCGYGWHCKYAADHGAAAVLGIDQRKSDQICNKIRAFLQRDILAQGVNDTSLVGNGVIERFDSL